MAYDFPNDLPYDIVKELSYCSNSKVLDCLITKHKGWLFIHLTIAQNLNASTKTLEKLAYHEISHVRDFVGNNPQATEKIKRIVLMRNTKENYKRSVEEQRWCRYLHCRN